MSMQPPPTSAELLAARNNPKASTTKQIVVLGMGMVAAGVMAGILGSISERSNPLWVLPVILSGMFCFIGFLATTAWTMRSRIGMSDTPVITTGAYLACVLATGGLVALYVEAPRLAHLIPLAAAAVIALLSLLGRLRNRARSARRDRLRSGAHVTGQVTDDGLAVFGDTPNIKLATIAITFRDLQGSQRWVTSMSVQSPSNPIKVGDSVDVWFDASDPGNVKRIVVAHDNGVSRLTPGQVGTGAKR